MNQANRANSIFVLIIIATISLGCNMLQPAAPVQPAATPPPATPLPATPAPTVPPVATATDTPAAKKAEKSQASGDGCNTTNVVRFAKGTKSGSYACSFDRGAGNYQHRYVLDAAALQDLTVQFTQNDNSNYTILSPTGVLFGNMITSPTKLQLSMDGKWVISVKLDNGVDFGNYRLNILIE